MNKFNERAWAGQLVAWIHEAIGKGTTVFQHASIDLSIKVASGRTKFPDVLLFTDKVSGIVFNGWELKFPDTPADDSEMLLNALEKAEWLKSDSLVTWNGAEAIIWKITDGVYRLENLERLKTYPREKGIATRNDLADPSNYLKHELSLKNRLFDILHDLQQLYHDGEIKEAINISGETISVIKETAKFLVPLFKQQIIDLKGENSEFRNQFNLWKINESSTLKILSTSSRRVENIEPEEILAKFTCYKLIAKVIFYRTLAENLGGKVPRLTLTGNKEVKKQLNAYFRQVKKIDYQAVFESDFTDEIELNDSCEKVICQFVDSISAFDFKRLPSNVISNILENLVPNEEKQKFGQYFTPESLAYLVAFSAIKNRNFVVIDPTSGTGTFLNAFYQIISYLGKKNHQELLSQIWGNDISHFPAVLSVINLYKQKVDDIANFPRVTRKDYFQLKPKQTIQIPDNKGTGEFNQVEIPQFDAIVSNFPFIQQEDIPNSLLTAQFKREFEQTQEAFLEGSHFKINERSDYYIYCFYNSLKFLKPAGYLSAITSNAWLGKNYGGQFKRFLLDNFSIRYIIRSNAEHWFKNSQASTVFVTVQRGKSEAPTRFVTLNFKLEEKLTGNTKQDLQFIEDFYTQIDNCELLTGQNWQMDTQYPTVFSAGNNLAKVSIVSRNILLQSLENQNNWSIYFTATNPLSIFEHLLISPQGTVFSNGRGTRTGQDEMHILTKKEVGDLNIEADFLYPVLQSSRHVKSILYAKTPDTFLFICDKSESELQKKYHNAFKWIKKWENARNKTGVLLPKVFKKRQPYWYSLKAERPANVFISLNPDKKLFFSYSPTPIYLNQRLVAIRTKEEDGMIITALLNAVVSLLIVELNGVSRNLGALDLNADFFKTKMKILDPNLLTKEAKEEILKKFASLSSRPIENYDKEFKKHDRISFDQAVLKSFKIDIGVLPNLYALLIETINNRVNIKNR